MHIDQNHQHVVGITHEYSLLYSSAWLIAFIERDRSESPSKEFQISMPTGKPQKSGKFISEANKFELTSTRNGLSIY